MVWSDQQKSYVPTSKNNTAVISSPGLTNPYKDKKFIKTANLVFSVEDVYAIGDCAQLQNPLPGRRPVEAIWYTGRMAGETVAHNICGNKVTYDPGIWFNSAKFLDIEGEVQVGIKESNFIVKKEKETIIIRMLEGDFPKYQDIIDKYRLWLPTKSNKAGL